MKVYYGTDEFDSNTNSIVTTGTFDGVHLGHQKIIERLKVAANKFKGESVLITYHPHPRHVLYPEDNTLQLLNTIDEKIELLDKFDIDHLVIQPFTKEFSRQSSIEFVRNVLVNQINTKKLVIGYNHHFGRNREGSFEHLKEFGPIYGFEVEEIPAQDVDEVNVSSTKIRKSLLAGDIKTANKYLNHPYKIMGLVVEGNKLGRSIGVPTANLFLKDLNKLIPKPGAYIVKVCVDKKWYKGILNIGVNPTVTPGNRNLKIETHILGFDQDIYGEEIEIDFFFRMRDEKKFESLEKLKNQLEIDMNRATNFF